MNDVADVILFFDLPLGEDALVVKFWGSDVNQAVDTASEPYHLPSKHVRGTVDVFQHKGYEAYANIKSGFHAVICVRKNFDLPTAQSIARQFLNEVASRLQDEIGDSYQ